MAEIKGSITISRGSSVKGNYISLTLKDEASRVVFASVRMSAETLGNVITCLSEQNVDIEVNGLDRVGKIKVTEPREITLPTRMYDREAIQKVIETCCKEDGWNLDLYLGSKSSIKHIGEGTLVRYAVYRYEEVV